MQPRRAGAGLALQAFTAFRLNLLTPRPGIGRLLYLTAFLLALACSSFAARATAPPLSEFMHISRTVTDGAPADIWTLAQSPTGSLWLGTGLGLYRFDGARFDRYPLREGQRLRSTNINALKVLPNGDIWLGLYTGGVVRLRDGMVTAYDQAQGMPGGRVLRIVTTPDGALWAAAGEGLARFDGQRWQRIGSDWGFPDDGADGLLTDHRGVLWVTTSNTLFYLKPGERQFRPTGEWLIHEPVMAEDGAGRLWVSEPAGGTRPLPDYAQGAPLSSALAQATATHAALPANPFLRVKQMLFARDGSMWMTESGAGVRRLRDPSAMPTGQRLAPQDSELFSGPDGLASEVVVPLLEDGDGDIWVGTNYGLESFRHMRLHPVAAFSQGVPGRLAVTPSGSGVLVANRNQTLWLDPPNPPQVRNERHGAHAMMQAPDGALWVLDDTMTRLQGGQRQLVDFTSVASSVSERAFAPDHAGGAWVSLVGKGVYHVTPNSVRREQRIDNGGPPPTAITVADNGDTWFGFDDEVVQLAGGTLRRYGNADGLLTGRTTAIHVGRDAIFVAGESGFARFDGRRFSTVSAERDDAFGHVSGIAETRDGDLWLNGARGVVQVKPADLPAMFEQQPPRLNYRLLDWHEGLPGIAQQAPLQSTLVRDAQDRLWFATNHGLAWLDPAELPRNIRSPTVEIQQLRVGDVPHAPVPDLQLPAGTRNLAIRYTALTLAVADRARFRYRLDGVDNDWQEAGTRHEATYANLADGHYRFRVVAANGDGVWNPQETTLDFRIAPTWQQSRLFALACGVALLLVTGGLYLLRARAIALRVRRELQVRHSERERIARELHDTLLQSTQGLIVNVQGLASTLPADAPVRQQIETLLDKADDVVLEARERVRDLRSPQVDGTELAQALEALGRVLGSGSAARLRVTTQGQPRALQRKVLDELYCIAREGLLNAYRHANASQITLVIAYGSDGLLLCVCDDGIGLSPQVRDRGAADGHWGLAGMHERAALIGARLTLASEVPTGTRIEVRVPALLAYEDPGLGHWLAPRWLRRRRARQQLHKTRAPQTKA